jgi:hypothetical protein
MKFVVENLGAVKKATIDLSKDLLIFTGDNNSGKTYLAYAVYALYKPNLSGSDFFPIKHFNLDEKGLYKYNILEALENQQRLNDIFNGYLIKRVNENLPKHFAIDKKHFAKTHLSLIDLENTINETDLINLKYEDLFHDGVTSALKEKGSSIMTFKKEGAKSQEEIDLSSKLRETNRKIALQLTLNPTYIFPSLREGIVVFNKELSIIKNKAFDKLLDSRDTNAEMWSSLARRFNRYPKPVKDSLEFAQNLDAYKSEKSKFAYLADELENTFLQGKIKIGDDGDVSFQMNENENTFEIHTASSTVKSLSYLSVYLRHLAKKGDFIIIDEPELNLHPDNQRKIARFFGRMINEGFKLLISTHSDYIVRELNNLIMLKEGEKNKPSETENLLEKHNYNKSQLIDKQQVGVYLFRQGKEVESMEVNEMGFSVPTIDEEINRLNQTTNDIIFSIFD